MVKQNKQFKYLNNTIHPHKKKVLIVDDDAGILDAISLILEDAGYNVLSISDGTMVFKKLEQFKPDMILLDVLLSGSDGRIICKELKDNPETKIIPIVMISAHPTAKLSIKDYGADGFLAKPFEAVELLTNVKRYTHSS
jgi:DNA-binding response OmpR family regulator